MGGGYNPTVSSNTNNMDTTDTSTCTDMMPTSTLLHHLKVNNDALSTGGGGRGVNPTVSPNSYLMATSTNMATPSYIASDNLSIMINSAAFQELQYDPAPLANGLSFLSNASVHSNDYNDFTPLFYPYDVSYEDKIPGTYNVHEI